MRHGRTTGCVLTSCCTVSAAARPGQAVEFRTVEGTSIAIQSVLSELTSTRRPRTQISIHVCVLKLDLHDLVAGAFERIQDGRIKMFRAAFFENCETLHQRE